MGCFRLVYHGGVWIISVRHCELTVSSQAKLLMRSHHAAVDNHAIYHYKKKRRISVKLGM